MKKRYSRIRVNEKQSHSISMLRNLLLSLLIHGSLVTTTSRAKMLKRFADKEISYASREKLVNPERQIVSHTGSMKAAALLMLYREYLQSKGTTIEGSIVSLRKVGFRPGDNAAKIQVILSEKDEFLKYSASKLVKKTKLKKAKKPAKKTLTEKEKEVKQQEIQKAKEAEIKPEKGEKKQEVRETAKKTEIQKKVAEKKAPVQPALPESKGNFFSRLGDRILGRRVQAPDAKRNRSTARSGI